MRFGAYVIGERGRTKAGLLMPVMTLQGGVDCLMRAQ
jgi:hypothetical protein